MGVLDGDLLADEDAYSRAGWQFRNSTGYPSVPEYSRGRFTGTVRNVDFELQPADLEAEEELHAGEQQARVAQAIYG